jgi:hypothetical protein
MRSNVYAASFSDAKEGCCPGTVGGNPIGAKFQNSDFRMIFKLEYRYSLLL